MIRVVVERQLKNGNDIGRLLRDLHMIAFMKKGHISNETLIKVGDSQTIAVVSTWQRLEDWKAWETSTERAAIVKEIDPLLAKRPRIKIYDVVSPGDYEFYADPESWMQEHEHPHFEG